MKTRAISIPITLLGLTTSLQASDGRCVEPMTDWQPRSAVAQMATEHGWTVRRIKIDDGCYEIYARDEAGKEIEISVNPASLAIRKIKSAQHYDDDKHGDEDKH